MKPIVINMFSGPGGGKSVTAARLFAHLKCNGINSELVTEYAKDLTWQKSFNVLHNQIYIFGKQQHRLWRLADQVNVIVTDAPLINCIVYGQEMSDTFKNLVIEEYNKFDNINVFIKRNHSFQTMGRSQNEDQAREIDDLTLSTLNKYNIQIHYSPLSASTEIDEMFESVLLNL